MTRAKSPCIVVHIVRLGEIELGLPALREIYKSKGLEREDVAKHLGVSSDLVYRWEADKRSVGDHYVKQLSRFLDCSSDFLLGLTEGGAA